MINVEVVSAVAEVNSPHPLVFSADSGTDYTCMWLVASSPPQTFTTNDTTSPITGITINFKEEKSVITKTVLGHQLWPELNTFNLCSQG